jgi:hypothetical protein
MFWRTLVLSVLWVYVHCQFEIKIKEKDTLYQVSLNESQSSIELQVNKDTMQSARHGYLIINPTSDHSFEVRSGMKGEEKLRCIGTHTTICIMSMDEEENHVKSIKGYNILVNMNCGNSCNGTLGISISDHIHSSHLGSTNIMMADVSELKLDLSFKLSEKTNKLRFHAGGYSKKHDLHSLSLTCYGNVISDAWPSESSHEFQLNHIHGNELSHVVYSHDKFFCKKYSDCNYKITCNTFEIYRIVFYAIESEKIETLTEFETYVEVADLV